MLFPLVVLSVLSVVGGIIQLPSFGIIPKGLRHRLEDWLHPVVAPGDSDLWDVGLRRQCGLRCSLSVAVVGIALGVLVYGRRKLRAIEPAILPMDGVTTATFPPSWVAPAARCLMRSHGSMRGSSMVRSTVLRRRSALDLRLCSSNPNWKRP